MTTQAKPVRSAHVIVWCSRYGAVPCETYLCDASGRATHGEDIDPRALADALTAGKPLLSYEAYADEASAQRRARSLGRATYEVRALPVGSFFYDADETLCTVA